MTTLEVLRLYAPEFSTVDDDTIGKWIELTKPLVSSSRFGSLYVQALALRTAHSLKLAGHGHNEHGTVEDTLRVASFSEGDASVAFRAINDNNLSLTTYGMQFHELCRRAIVPITIAGVP